MDDKGMKTVGLFPVPDEVEGKEVSCSQSHPQIEHDRYKRRMYSFGSIVPTPDRPRMPLQIWSSKVHQCLIPQ